LSDRFELAVFAFRHGLARPSGRGNDNEAVAHDREERLSNRTSRERKRRALVG